MEDSGENLKSLSPPRGIGGGKKGDQGSYWLALIIAREDTGDIWTQLINAYNKHWPSKNLLQLFQGILTHGKLLYLN